MRMRLLTAHLKFFKDFFNPGNNEDTSEFLPHIRQSLENLKPVLNERIGNVFALEVPL